MRHHLAPYQIFFPIGTLCAIVAISVWFIQDLGWLSAPVLIIHSKLVMGGFIWSFIVGFLMTAVPRMTGTPSAHLAEYLCAFLLIVSLIVFSWMTTPQYYYVTHILLILFLLTYAGRRVLKSQKSIPVFFSHIILAMILTLLGAACYIKGQNYMGLHLYHMGPVLLLVLGIGTRFFSFLSGLPSIFEGSASDIKRLGFHTCGVLIAVFLFLAGRGLSWAYLPLFLLTLYYVIDVWKIFRPSSRPSALKYGVRVVALSIPLCFLLLWLKPLLFVTWMHILFIGCFTMITFAVATRVTLAHGAYPTDLELRSKVLWWMVGLLILALIARIFYGFTYDPMWRKSMMHSAATFWALAVIIWSVDYIRKIFKPGPMRTPSC
ncbi:MAG: NnrS family protein [Bdellovibrionaceae bacterium]|nr:NnrS family protein [Pseudobdellovibrionaceae bacterium]